MKNMLKVALILVVVLGVGAGAYYYLLGNDSQGERVLPGMGRETEPETFTPPEGTEAKPPLPSEKFSGKLEEADLGCFADGECFAIVGGKHVTLLMGFRNNPVIGQVIGVPTLGDLEGAIGKDFEVYAQKQENGTYTLYGNENFYLKLKP